MRQHIEFVAKIVNPKEQQTSKGYLYRFSVPIVDMDGEKQITEWLQCAIFLKTQDKRILTHKNEFHFTGELKIKKKYQDYPQGLSLFGFEIEPVLGKVYKIAKPKHEDAIQAPKAVPEVSSQGQRHSTAFPEIETNQSVPF